MLTADEKAVLGTLGPTWIECLEQRKERIIQRVFGEYRAGKTDFLASVAELSVTIEQINETKSAIRSTTAKKE